jgi:hypothetical protein
MQVFGKEGERRGQGEVGKHFCLICGRCEDEIVRVGVL